MALTKRYVSSAGGGAHDGTTEADAFTWAEMVTDLNTPRAGYKYLVKGAVALGTTTTTLTGDGSATSPNIIEGYNSTEGDLYLGRSAGGALNTTNYPAISYTGTTARFDASGSTHLELRCISITSAASNPTVTLGANSGLSNSLVTNTGTNAASSAAQGGTTDHAIMNCDLRTADTGAGHAVRFIGAGWFISGCRIKCLAGTGLLVRSAGIAIHNTIYECTIGLRTDNTSAAPICQYNTIVNCSGDGIDIITSSTQLHTIQNNHITGCGGWGIDFNTSTCQKRLGFNRFRDNTSGNVNGGGDWEEGTSLANIATDDTDAVDFTDQSTDDYSLKAGAPATSKGIGYLVDIGANGSPVVTGGVGPLVGPGRLIRN